MVRYTAGGYQLCIFLTARGISNIQNRYIKPAVIVFIVFSCVFPLKYYLEKNINLKGWPECGMPSDIDCDKAKEITSFMKGHERIWLFLNRNRDEENIIAETISENGYDIVF